MTFSALPPFFSAGSVQPRWECSHLGTVRATGREDLGSPSPLPATGPGPPMAFLGYNDTSKSFKPLYFGIFVTTALSTS